MKWAQRLALAVGDGQRSALQVLPRSLASTPGSARVTLSAHLARAPWLAGLPGGGDRGGRGWLRVGGGQDRLRGRPRWDARPRSFPGDDADQGNGGHHLHRDPQPTNCSGRRRPSARTGVKSPRNWERKRRPRAKTPASRLDYRGASGRYRMPPPNGTTTASPANLVAVLGEVPRPARGARYAACKPITPRRQDRGEPKHRGQGDQALGRGDLKTPRQTRRPSLPRSMAWRSAHAGKTLVLGRFLRRLPGAGTFVVKTMVADPTDSAEPPDPCGRILAGRKDSGHCRQRQESWIPSTSLAPRFMLGLCCQV